MKLIICETSLQELQRLTALARATNDVVIRADYYRLAERCREHIKDGLAPLRLSR
ncbi:hypothetical protein [Tardiphaga sp. 813_E8_N1_3]|uniref:hypothetical protein n=1 Tax=Tardiphaga sp. 813_E8_N1_3 TaxID=3240760 RepID=UPI003F28E875